MIFRFLKYLQPTNYFQLRRKDGSWVFPITEELPAVILGQLKADNNFNSELATQYDISWQAIQKGYIGDTPAYRNFEKLPLEDEYRFVRKYFHPIWSLYVIGIRFFSLKNPIREFSAFLKSRKIKRSDYLRNPIRYDHYTDFQSTLLADAPFISIIIPTLNRYEYLKDVLEDIEKQDYTKYEVIIVDQSVPFQEDFYRQFKININLIRQEECALWLARNHAIELSRGEYILLFDDDSRVKPDWITNHLRCLDFFIADVSSGVSISTVGAPVPPNYSFFRISDQIDTGNVLIKKQVFKKIGLFDRQFEKQRMGDGEFGLRSHLNGFLNISNPYAERLHLKVSTGGLRQMGSWDAFRPKNLFSPRPIPSVLYFFRKYYGPKAALWSLLKTVPSSIIPYRYKKNRKMIILGVVISLFLLPFVLLQVLISWRKSSYKIKQGSLISELK